MKKAQKIPSPPSNPKSRKSLPAAMVTKTTTKKRPLSDGEEDYDSLPLIAKKGSTSTKQNQGRIGKKINQQKKEEVDSEYETEEEVEESIETENIKKRSAYPRQEGRRASKVSGKN